MGEDLSIVMSQLEINQTITTDQLDGSEEISIKAESRSLRKRSLFTASSHSSDLSLHKIRNRKIQKPKKLETESQIKNFYINVNKKVKLKPILLETIYEEAEEENSSDNNNDQVPAMSDKKKSIGLRKIKRQIALNDGLNATKSLKEKRKNQIKKYLGSRKKPKKIATEKFMHIFQSLISSGDIVGQDVVTVPCKGELIRILFM